MYNLHPHNVTDSGEQDDVKKVYSLDLINYANKPSVWTLRSEIDGEGGGGMLDLPNIGSRATGSPAVLIDCQPRVTQLHSTNATTSTIHDRVQTHRPTRSRPIWDPGRTGTEVGMKPSRDSTGVTSETEEERIQDTGSLLSLSPPSLFSFQSSVHRLLQLLFLLNDAKSGDHAKRWLDHSGSWGTI